jgi:hypothetical protein
MLRVILVPAGTVCCSVNVSVVFVLSTNAQFVAFAAEPEAEIAPVLFAGFVPPTAESTLPLTELPVEAIFVALSVVLAVMEGTVTVAAPLAFKVTVCEEPPLILYVTIEFAVPEKV